MTAKTETGVEAFTRLGLALYGNEPDWQARLARAVGVQRETIRGWQRKNSPLHDPRSPVWDTILNLADVRVDALMTARDAAKGWRR